MKSIVLCGSMAFIEEMKCLSATLLKIGLNPIIPREYNSNEVAKSDINEFKRLVSRDHFDKITTTDTSAVLIINASKGGINNYIGANTFAEIAMAFYFRKTIYILNGIYKPYQDELLAWGAIFLHGNIKGIDFSTV